MITLVAASGGPGSRSGTPTGVPLSYPAGGVQPAAIVSYRDAVARAAPSVVTVHSSNMVPGRLPLTGKALVNGLASGVILDRDGYIVTNYHVVEDASELAVALADGTLHQTRIVGADPESDIALLRSTPRDSGRSYWPTSTRSRSATSRWRWAIRSAWARP